MNLMPVISVVVFLLLLSAAVVVYRMLRNAAEDTDGACGIVEKGELQNAKGNDLIGKM